MIRKSTILLVAAAAFVAIATSQATAGQEVPFKAQHQW